ncbi:hypothetical protein CPS_0553 [Colwellia psychrerythraea 34H]|uniref:Uncharacterized protein n=1 Tax=Colwellia psychrerythraea (strain 34H / ATCC BAA-681) TaxID=167879 RepID=Q489F3_COLP3|nr:hypothetical protein CPS_0553 [Colwellia psychrerythraea 34H]
MLIYLLTMKISMEIQSTLLVCFKSVINIAVN